MTPHSKNISSGVTLVELVAVLTVFMLIIGAAVTMFISIIQHQQRILKEQNLANQASYALDYISRTARTAIKDSTGSCLTENQIEYPGYHYILTRRNTETGYFEGMKFLSNDNTCEEFFLDSDGVFKEVRDGGIPQPVFSDTFTVLYARFLINGDKDVQGASENDVSQPRITMVFNIQTQSNGVLREKIIQTTISQINLNVP